MMAELVAVAPPKTPSRKDPCGSEMLEPYEALWAGQARGFANARLDAFLSDLADLSREKSIPLVLSIRGPGTDCAARSERRQRLAATAGRRVASAGLAFVDHELAMDRLPDAHPRAALSGFGVRLGFGHLNEAGHRIYAAVLTETIARHLLQR